MNGTMSLLQTPFSGQGGFVRYVNGALFVMKRDGPHYAAGEYRDYVLFHSADCTGAMYLPVSTPDLVQVTRLGETGSGGRNYYRKTGTETIAAAGSWSRYATFTVAWHRACMLGPSEDNGFSLPSVGTVFQTYEPTTVDAFPTPPANMTPPFTWSAN